MSGSLDGQATTVTDTTTRQLVVFSLAGEEYALPIAAVSEIIRHATARSVASDTPGVRGVIGLRGKIVPIVDLIDRLGLPHAQAEATDAHKILILDSAERSQMGVIVDDVDEVVTVTHDQLEHVPTASSDSVDVIAKIDDRLVIVLNPDGLFPPVEALAKS